MSGIKRRAKLRDLLTQLIERQDGQCFYCSCEIYQIGDAQLGWRPNPRPGVPWSGPPPKLATIEHLIKQADGGTDDEANLVAACTKCNNSRGDVPWETWKEQRSKEWVS